MHLKHLKSIASSTADGGRVCASTWSPNGLKFAVAKLDNLISLYDETGERKDKFQTKPVDPTKKHCIVAIAFSPDSTKLAVAQSDQSIFVYSIGLDWGDKKSICNKFIQSSDILCMCWPFDQTNGLAFGLVDGKVRVGSLKTNKAATLYQADSAAISLTSHYKGTAIASGHLDGSVYKFYFEDESAGSQGKLCTHTSTPHMLAWGIQLVVVGTDNVICSYSSKGKLQQKIKGIDDIDYASIATGSTGETIVVGGVEGMKVLHFKASVNKWEDSPFRPMDGIGTAISVALKPDGSRLVIGNSTGVVELFDSCIRRLRYKAKFELTYTSSSQVVVKRISNGSRIVLKSQIGAITKIDIFKDQYLVAHTDSSILLADMHAYKLSEVAWQSGKGERFYFDVDGICMVFSVGELSIVEYGVNQIIGTCRTEHTNPHSISIRLSENSSETKKVLAYLTDAKSIQVNNLVTGQSVAEILHDCRIDWLELSTHANKILYRDCKLQVFLYNLSTQKRSLLANYSSYVQWVPESDAIVIQNRSNLLVWYFVDSPEQFSIIPINGDVETIERVDNKSIVSIMDGQTLVPYELDELMIEFGSSFDSREYVKVINLLETLDWNDQVETMWRKLSVLALEDGNVIMAERCYAEMGDSSSAKYLRSTYQSTNRIAAPDANFYLIRAKLLIFAGNYKEAEALYLQNGQVDEVLSMYQDMHMWDEAIKVAELKNHSDLVQIKESYYAWLQSSGQEEVLGQIKEQEQEYAGACDTYLRGGIPGKAAQIIIRFGLIDNRAIVIETASSLIKCGLYEKAGDLYLLIDNYQKASECFIEGGCYRKAIDIARKHDPESIVDLEERWGDHLLNQNKVDQAINHFIEAGKTMKALRAAISDQMFVKAASIIDNLSSIKPALSYILEVACHFERIEDYTLAEKYYLMCEKGPQAAEMYLNARRWSDALNLAGRGVSEYELFDVVLKRAEAFESTEEFHEAETIYLLVSHPDRAIQMYRNAQRFKEMVSLVKQFHPDSLVDTYIYLAKLMESQGNFASAEQYFLFAGDWKSAVQMHCVNGSFEAAFKVAKAHGGVVPSSHVAYLWTKSLPFEGALKTLTRIGLFDDVFEIAVESQAFDFAFGISAGLDQKAILGLHTKHAMYLEDDGRFMEAELAYIQAGKAKEAVLMYIHTENWVKALSVAEKYDPERVSDVLYSEARSCFTARNYTRMEMLLLRSPRPDLAISFYKEAGMFTEALKFAKNHVTSKVAEIMLEMKHLPGLNSQNMRQIIKNEESIPVQRTDPSLGLEALYRQGEFNKCLGSAKNNGSESFVNYTTKIIESSIKSKDIDLVLSLLIKHGPCEVESCGNIYKNLFELCINSDNISLINACREFVQKMVLKTIFSFDKQIDKSPSYEQAYPQHIRLIHLLSVKAKVNQSTSDTSDIGIGISLSLIRYAGVYRIDQALFDAGDCMRASGRMTDDAFGIWNIMLDVCDALEDRDLDALSNSDFKSLNIVSAVEIPSTLIPDSKRERVRDWILEKSLVRSIRAKIDTYNCVKCKAALFIGETGCFHCKYEHAGCIVTGKPVVGESRACSSCQKQANASDWVQFVSQFKACPWCRSPQSVGMK